MDIKSYAKINLSLDVLGRRENGYHDIDSVMQGIDMCDELSLSVGKVDCTYPCADCQIGDTTLHLYLKAEGLEPDEKNLAVKGVRALIESGGEHEQSKTGEPTDSTLPEGSEEPTDSKIIDFPQELSIIIDKRLPIAAGIAGGSGNAAVSMLALNAIAGSPFSMRELMDIGSKVGADVPFSIMMNAKKNEAILGKLAGIDEASVAARAQGIGDILEPMEPITRYVIMANPGVAVSTKEVYEAIDALPAEKRERLGLWGNVMEAYTLERYEEAAQLKRVMEENLSADTVLMSGSGPTMVAYYTDKEKWLKDSENTSWILEGWRAWPSVTG